MQLFSNCSGPCCLCSAGGGCLAGHGDDDFWPARKEQIIERLNKGQYEDDTQTMKNYLKEKYGYDYDSPKKNFDRATALMVLQDLVSFIYPSTDIFGGKTLVISRAAFESVRHKYLDNKENNQ